MALVNALQSHSPEMFNQQGGEPSGRFMKIRSLWSFPVKSPQDAEHAESKLLPEQAGESATPSSFVT
jgi:hypothetical protein